MSTVVGQISRRRVAVASMVGTTVEFYDFYIYATAAVSVFPLLFFPSAITPPRRCRRCRRGRPSRLCRHCRRASRRGGLSCPVPGVPLAPLPISRRCNSASGVR